MPLFVVRVTYFKEGFASPVIPTKAGIQIVWKPAMATPGLDARLRGTSLHQDPSPKLQIAVLSKCHFEAAHRKQDLSELTEARAPGDDLSNLRFGNRR